LVSSRLSPKRAERVEAHLAQRIRQVDEAEILHAAAFREWRALHRDPLYLSDEGRFVDRDQDVAVHPWEGPCPSGVERHRFRRFDIQADLDHIRRNELYSSDSQTLGMREWCLAHPASPFVGSFAAVASSARVQRFFKSSAIRKLV